MAVEKAQTNKWNNFYSRIICDLIYILTLSRYVKHEKDNKAKYRACLELSRAKWKTRNEREWPKIIITRTSNFVTTEERAGRGKNSIFHIYSFVSAKTRKFTKWCKSEKKDEKVLWFINQFWEWASLVFVCCNFFMHTFLHEFSLSFFCFWYDD